MQVPYLESEETTMFLSALLCWLNGNHTDGCEIRWIVSPPHFTSRVALCCLRFTTPIIAHERQDNHFVIFLHPTVGQIKESDLVILLP